MLRMRKSLKKKKSEVDSAAIEMKNQFVGRPFLSLFPFEFRLS